MLIVITHIMLNKISDSDSDSIMLGVRGHNYAKRENFENMVHFGAFWYIF